MLCVHGTRPCCYISTALPQQKSSTSRQRARTMYGLCTYLHEAPASLSHMLPRYRNAAIYPSGLIFGDDLKCTRGLHIRRNSYCGATCTLRATCTFRATRTTNTPPHGDRSVSGTCVLNKHKLLCVFFVRPGVAAGYCAPSKFCLPCNCPSVHFNTEA